MPELSFQNLSNIGHGPSYLCQGLFIVTGTLDIEKWLQIFFMTQHREAIAFNFQAIAVIPDIKKQR
jgi:hypothetical protein